MTEPPTTGSGAPDEGPAEASAPTSDAPVAESTDEPIDKPHEIKPLSDDDIRDALPDDLDAAGYVGPYLFPNNNRRRIPGIIYLVLALGCFLLWVTHRDGPQVLVNTGFLAAAIGLALVGTYSIISGWNLDVDEADALVEAVKIVGFPVGHASAQMGWRGLLSRPTWRILLYSAEDPPTQRGLVLVDGVQGQVLEWFVEDNPEDWSQFED